MVEPGTSSCGLVRRSRLDHLDFPPVLELRRPDGTSLRTVLVTYGVSVQREEDGSLAMPDDPADPEIKLTIPGDVPTEQVPAGTEVWLL